MTKSKVLLVVSGASVWALKDGTKHPAGFWAAEFIHPHQVFTKAGYDITIATPGGVTPTLDEVSLRVDLNGGPTARITPYAQAGALTWRTDADMTSPTWPATLPPPREPGRPYRVCLVCLGNICRSPMAEAVLRAELDRAGLDAVAEVDSAGTGDWHAGDRMDPRARAELSRRGYDGTAHRARQILPSWLAGRDLILAMDQANLADLREMADPADRDRIRLLRSFDPAAGDHAEVPDPYYGGSVSFGETLDLIEAAAAGLTTALRAAQAS